jgi:hypothetical protein
MRRPDRGRPPPKTRERRPAGTRAAHLENNNTPSSNGTRPKPQARRDFNLGRHLLDEGLSPPIGFAWLFHRTGGRLCVSHYLLEEVGDQTIAGTA